MKQHNHIVVFITAANHQEAEAISLALLQQRLVACANIVPEISSHFWWEDKLDSTAESLLIAKTRDGLLPDIIKSVKETHSYTNPEIIALPIIGGSQEYLDWIDQEVV